MQYFRNVELTKRYPISKTGVTRWVALAQQGKLDLQLVEVAGKHYIANTEKNRIKIEQMIEANRKYLNSRALKTVTPTKKFYELYSLTQAMDIASNIETYHEIPLKYSYFDGGAAYWEQYMQRVAHEPTLNMLTGTNKLIELSESYINSLLNGSQRVNVIDLGVGDAQPAKSLLAHFLDKGVLGRYIGIDLSETMLELAERNVTMWFGDRVKMEIHVRDIATDSFNDLFLDQYFDTPDKPINLILFFGGTLTNFRAPTEVLQVIRRSMGKNDLLLYNKKLDTPKTRQYFDFSGGDEAQKPAPLSPKGRFMLDLLNINPDCYEVEQLFDEYKRERIIRIRLKMALSLRFKFAEGERTVDLDKDETILVWRALHQNALEVIEQFDQSGFRTLHTGTTKDGEYFLSIAGIKTTY